MPQVHNYILHDSLYGMQEADVRLPHRYEKTCGFSKMGNMSMGKVLGFGTPQHTVYPYYGIVGMSTLACAAPLICVHPL